MKLIPQWRSWWKRHSVHIASLMPAITYARAEFPSVREFLPPDVYGEVMLTLFIAMVVVMNIHQDAVSGPQP